LALRQKSETSTVGALAMIIISTVTNCSECGGHTVVIDSRKTPKGLRRRRQCDGCGVKFNTFEVSEKDLGRVNKFFESLQQLFIKTNNE